ncbi:MAG: hypothetical protein IJ578_04785 [Bacteroidales bacterium]|nr:hypothetical protein [Bacteroidales bacterium]MBR1577508.1 hypothetical protein [Bacteroidales bacterium]
MKMKRLIAPLVAILTLTCPALAQETAPEDFQARYERLVRNVGYSGVGVETLLDRWEAADPDNKAIPMARFNYYFVKSQHAEIVSKPGVRRYLGNQPTFTLKDSDGNDVNYFEEITYDEELFGEAMKVLDRQLAAQPDELRWHYLKITALTAYEKESPDMAAAELKALIERDASAHPAWTLDGEAASSETFQQGVGEYCALFFQTASPASYEYFREISERMTKLFPKNSVFVGNLGSYQQVVKGNDKQAVKFYKKALKLDPEDYAARRNMQLIERRQAQAKAKKK